MERRGNSRLGDISFGAGVKLNQHLTPNQSCIRLMYLLNKFQLDIAYRQFAVSQFAVDSPFNDWRAQDVAQGFAWRPETVCFSVLYDGLMTIDLYRLNRAEWDYVEFREGALRIILIPFT